MEYISRPRQYMGPAELRKKNILAAVLGAGATIVILGMFAVSSYTKAVNAGNIDKNPNEEKVTVDIKQGMTANGIANTLEERGAITSAMWFRVYVKLHGLDSKLQPGTYTFVKLDAIRDVVGAMTGAIAPTEKTLRIIEGWTLQDIAVAVEKAGMGTRDEFLQVTGKPATDYREDKAVAPSIDWAKEFPVLADKPAYVSLEGYLFPDTYRFALDATPEDVVRKLLGEFTRKFDKDMIAAAKARGKSVFEIVTMASVVEKEVNGDIDRAKVADLLWRRNDINWALQCDSTVKYATGNFGDTPFTNAVDRASQSEYNTYQHPGLPLGPISNPGVSSLRATLYPLANEAWYFLTTPNGEVKYASSLDEHNANKIYMR